MCVQVSACGSGGISSASGSCTSWVRAAQATPGRNGFPFEHFNNADNCLG